jgi:uncharacterized membrane protein
MSTEDRRVLRRMNARKRRPGEAPTLIPLATSWSGTRPALCAWFSVRAGFTLERRGVRSAQALERLRASPQKRHPSGQMPAKALCFIPVGLTASRRRSWLLCAPRAGITAVPAAAKRASYHYRRYEANAFLFALSRSPCRMSNVDSGHSAETAAAQQTSRGRRESQVALWLGCAFFGLGWLLPTYWSWHDQVNLDTHLRMLVLYTVFAVLHSGGAALRPRAAELLGERLYRVLFAFMSLPTAGVTVAYFLAHRRDGISFSWLQQDLPAHFPFFHEMVWVVSAISFLFLYPATLDLAQVSAIKRPTVRLFEQGIIRVTRHPQLWGQFLWCLAHGAWIGSSMAITVSCALIGHHFIAAWHGDRRLRQRFGAATWDAFAERTSLWPFWSMLQGKQSPRVAIQEMLRPAYIGVLVFVYLAYKAHPLLFEWAAANTRFLS